MKLYFWQNNDLVLTIDQLEGWGTNFYILFLIKKLYSFFIVKYQLKASLLISISWIKSRFVKVAKNPPTYKVVSLALGAYQVPWIISVDYQSGLFFEKFYRRLIEDIVEKMA